MKKFLIMSILCSLKSFALDDTLSKSEEVSQILAQNTYEPNYFGMILGLFLVIVLIYITGFLYQKMTKATVLNKSAYLNKAQVISTTSLGQGRNVHVIKIGEKACLIGSTQNNITYLSDVELENDEKESEVLNEKNS